MTARDRTGGVSHGHAKFLFSKAWDGEITAEELDALVEHLRSCRDCAAATEKMRGFMQRVEDLLRDTHRVKD